MGLFKRRDQTKEELTAMREDVRALREALARTDAVKDRLAERLGQVDAENQRLTAQVGTVEERVGEVADKVGTVEEHVVTATGSIGPTVDRAIRSAVDDAPKRSDVDSLRDEIRGLNVLVKRVGSNPSDSTLANIRTQLEELTTMVQTHQGQIADVALVATDAAERVDQTDAKVAGLVTPDDWAPIASDGEEDAETRRQVDQLAEKVAALDSRVDQVSLELTNQLTELSSDLDRASREADANESIDRINGQLGDITGSQERLANEQARYAIQFRDDLAQLADRLRKR